MIKLFTKSRRDSLSKSRFSDYLFYAPGEILLVMIGILLALEVNDWAQNRAERKQEKVLLTNLLSDLQEELILLKELIGIEQNYFNEAMATFDHFAKHGSFTRMDSILTKMNSLYMR